MVCIDLCRIDLLDAAGSPALLHRSRRGSAGGLRIYFYDNRLQSPISFSDVGEFVKSLKGHGITFRLEDVALLNSGGTFYCTYWSWSKKLCVYDTYIKMYNEHSLGTGFRG